MLKISNKKNISNKYVNFLLIKSLSVIEGEKIMEKRNRK